MPTKMQLCPWTQAFQQEVLYFLTAWRSDHQPEVLRCRPERPGGRREDPEPQLSPIQFSVVNGSAAPPAVTGCNCMRPRHDRQVARCAGTTKTPNSTFRHGSGIKSHVKLELIWLTCDAFVTKVSLGTQTRRYRRVVTNVGITARTRPTATTPSMAIAVCCQPIQAMNRIELRTPRMIQK